MSNFFRSCPEVFNCQSELFCLRTKKLNALEGPDNTMKINKPIFIIAILGVLLSVLLCGIYFQFSYFEPDTVSYLFQAKLFAEGKLSFPAPPEHGFSSSPHINVLNGKWYSKYPFGNALMLMFGVFINAPWLIPALATGGALVFLYLFVKEIYGDIHNGIALIAAVLGLISPATLGMGVNVVQ